MSSMVSVGAAAAAFAPAEVVEAVVEAVDAAALEGAGGMEI